MTAACNSDVYYYTKILKKGLLLTIYGLLSLLLEMQPAIALETVNLKPQIRRESRQQTIYPTSIEQIRSSFVQQRIVSPSSIAGLPVVVGSAEQHLILGTGQMIYAKGNGLVVGQHYGVYRKGALYQLDTAQLKFNFDALDLVEVASATVIAAEKGLSTLVLNKSQSGEVRLGDVIMPIYPERSAEMQFTPQNTGLLAGGRIIRIMGSINFAAKHSIVTVDRGRLQGAVVGQVLQIQATQLDDHKNNIELPAQTLGQLLVFNVFEQLSYAYILDSRLPIKIGAFLEVAQTAEK